MSVSVHNFQSLRPLPKVKLDRPTLQTLHFGAGPKHLAIFTTNIGGQPDPYTRELISVAQDNGWTIQEIHPQDIVLEANENEMAIWIDGKRYTKPPFGYVLPRMGARYVTEGALTALKALEKMGVDVINDPDGIRTAENKMAAHLAFSSKSLPQPITMYRPPKAPESIEPFYYYSNYGLSRNQQARLGQNILLKPNFNTSGGKGKKYMTGWLSAHINDEITPQHIAQSYYKDRLTEQGDFRYLVCDGKVIMATQRQLNEEENVWSPKPRKINPEMEQLALKAMDAVGLTFGTVDILKTTNGLKLLEINPSPGLHHHESLQANTDEFEETLNAISTYIDAHPRLSLLA